ncbi:MAG TPA: carotenoid biosynthesis protein [Thermoanaerobaculia bacterium]|nr:carotenoid biosynthesis protein [Thermoanaerobaculia bacterium]
MSAWGGKSGAEKVLIVLLVLLVLVLAAFALRPQVQDLKVPFEILVPVFAVFSLVHCAYLLGWRHTAAFFAIAAVVSMGAELIGTVTGAIFGEYHYTEVLGPKLFGEVPIVIPLAWFLMLYPSWLIANLMVRGEPVPVSRGFGDLAWRSLLGALVMTAWDLTLDPYMVGFAGAWVWDQPGAYFGIPIQNYVGWVGTSFVVLLLFQAVVGKLQVRPLGSGDRWVIALPLVSYGFQSLGDVLLGHPPETAIVSPFVMGIPLLFAATAFGRGGFSRFAKGEPPIS